MEWKQLLSTKRTRGSVNKRAKGGDLRSEFERDYQRIIGSASFRRLQDKTQVFPLDKSDFIRTRLTHSLEVSSFAKSLGQNIAENLLTYRRDPGFTPRMKEDICNILQCAGLIHDIGNPPFGHFGEVEIREWFERKLPVLKFRGKPVADVLTEQMKQDLYRFEGNAQALRLVTKLHYLVNDNGMNLTYALLGTIIKYPVNSLQADSRSGDIKDKKVGYYYADTEIFEDIQRETGTNGKRHPLTFILEAADDIAYKTADIEDAFVKGFISYHGLLEELKELQILYRQEGPGAFYPADKLEELYLYGKERHMDHPEEFAIKNWIIRVQGFLVNCATYGFTSNYSAIMCGEYRHDLFYRTYADKLMELLGDYAFRKVFTSDAIYRMEVSESAMLDYLMEKFVSAAIKYDDSTKKLGTIESRMIWFISDTYKSAYHRKAKGQAEKERLYLRLLLVTDYICGMTDSYAKKLYQELNAVG